MVFRVGHLEDTRGLSRSACAQILIPRGLYEPRADLVDVLETSRVVDGNFIGCDAYNWAVFLVECVDVVCSRSTKDGYL